MKKENKNKLLILTLLLFLLIIVGATYAFFQSQNDSEVSTDVNIETKTTDSLSFENGDSINIHIDATSFTEGGDNATGSTNVKAKLQASNIDYEATEKYYLYLKIDENGFTYTTTDLKPELILEITDPGGQPVTKVTGLDYVTSNGISGFDITAKKGTIPIALDYTIEATGDDTEIESKKGTKEQTWQFKITFINLNSDQQVNAGKSLVASALITHDKQEDIYTNAYHNTCKDNTLACHIAKTYGSDDNLVYHDSNLYLGANDLSYRFSGGEYALTELSLKNNYKTVNDVIKLTCDGDVLENSNDYCATGAKYTLSYNPSIEDLTTLKATLDKAIEDGYLYDNNVKNYVCFGDECTNNKDNLYRIIGVFKVGGEYQVKLIKADEADKTLLGESGDFVKNGKAYHHYLGNHDDWPRYYWNNSTQTNSWSESQLNNSNLNEIYLGNLNNWASKIAMTDWQVGGVSNDLGYKSNAHTAYEYELGKFKQEETHQAKIGMMYVSDYYYAAKKDYWILPGDITDEDNDYKKAAWDNWAWIGDDYWFITSCTSSPDCVFNASSRGTVYTHVVTLSNRAVRPVFYLNSNVTYVRGTGTSTDPIIVN